MNKSFYHPMTWIGCLFCFVGFYKTFIGEDSFDFAVLGLICMNMGRSLTNEKNIDILRKTLGIKDD